MTSPGCGVINYPAQTPHSFLIMTMMWIFLFAVRMCIQFSWWRPTGFALDPLSTQQGSCGELWPRIGFEYASNMLFKRPEMFWCYVRRDIIWWTVLGFAFDPSQIHNKYLTILNSTHLLLLRYLPHSLNVPGVWWTQRMSLATSSQSRCLQRCETGWPPPSPARWAWCCDATKRNLASAASSMLFRPAYLWKGDRVQSPSTKTHAYSTSSSALNNWYHLPPFVFPPRKCYQSLVTLHQETLKAINMFCLALQKDYVIVELRHYLSVKQGQT